MNAPTAPDPLDLVFGALADKTRRTILGRLAEGERSVMELVAGFDLSQPAVSKHLKVLEGAGLVTRAKDGQFRPVRLDPKGLESAASWLGSYRQFWEESLDQLEVYVRELQQREREQQQHEQNSSSSTSAAPKKKKKAQEKKS